MSPDFVDLLWCGTKRPLANLTAVFDLPPLNLSVHFKQDRPVDWIGLVLCLFDIPCCNRMCLQNIPKAPFCLRIYFTHNFFFLQSGTSSGSLNWNWKSLFYDTKTTIVTSYAGGNNTTAHNKRTTNSKDVWVGNCLQTWQNHLLNEVLAGSVEIIKRSLLQNYVKVYWKQVDQKHKPHFQ